MKKVKRSARLVEMTQYLISRPHTLIPLATFVERYDAAKSSISEDLTIIKEVLDQNQTGELQTIAGAAGGVKYIPGIGREEAMQVIKKLCEELEDSDRILPGGYLYMSDLLGRPLLLDVIGRMFASAFKHRQIDVVMTVETKGIVLAHATAAHLNVPVVIVRRDNKVTEGSTVSINYVSGSTKSIRTMSLARRALAEESNVLIIDDFMKAGGTVQGMMELLKEFRARVQGVGVFVETANESVEEHLIKEYVSLARLTEVDLKSRRITVVPGNYFDQVSKEESD